MKTGISLAALVSGLIPLDVDVSTPDDSDIAAICKYINSVGVETKNTPTHIALRYTARLEPKKDGLDCQQRESNSKEICKALTPDFQSGQHIGKLKTHLGGRPLDFFDDVKLVVPKNGGRDDPVEWDSDAPENAKSSSKYTALTARQAAYGQLSLAYGDGNTIIVGQISDETENTNHRSFGQVFSEQVAIAQWGRDYKIPVPYPRLFGTSTFSAGFSESGSLRTIGYSREGGADALAAGLTSIRDEFAGPTTAEQAAQVKAEADLIAQQQRLLRCQLAPDDCQ
ncbi:MAG: hypothetical protein WD397_05600 [Wenzhouxiangellaceae bacterium]